MILEDYIILRPEQEKVFEEWKKYVKNPSCEKEWMSPSMAIFAGCFVIDKPRQWGKSTILKKMAMYSTRPKIVTGTFSSFSKGYWGKIAKQKKYSHINNLIAPYHHEFQFRGLNCENIDLFLDDLSAYGYASNSIQEALKFNWRTVTVFGS